MRVHALMASGLMYLAAGSALAAPCAGFLDVDGSSPFCVNVEWMKNRGITLGLTATQYAPNDPVTRLQMAAFSGGGGNRARGNFSTVVGGINNDATGAQSTVIGGARNVASGDNSVAAGELATVVHRETFLWNGWSGFGAATSVLPNAVELRGETVSSSTTVPAAPTAAARNGCTSAPHPAGRSTLRPAVT